MLKATVKEMAQILYVSVGIVRNDLPYLEKTAQEGLKIAKRIPVLFDSNKAGVEVELADR
jgi:hypothetical protein